MVLLLGFFPNPQCAAHWTVFKSTPSLYISHKGESSRSLPILERSSLTAYSISSSVVKRPIVKRMELWASSSERPSARRTYEGSRLAEVQAEPEETATSLIPMISDSPSTKLKLTLRLPGMRRSMSPLTYTSSMSSKPFSSLSRRARMRSLSAAISSFAIRNASPMAAAVDLRLDAHARLPAHVQRADALRAVDLVCGHGQQIHLQLLQVDGNLSGGLHRVAVKDDAFGPADLADLGDRLDHADLVVHHHHRHEDGIGAEGRLEFVQVEQAVLLRIEVGRHEALALELAHRVEHRLVLGLHRDDVLALALVEIRRALDGEVVAFGRARGPDDLLGIGVQQRGDVLARFLDRFLRFPAERMRAARRIAELLGEKRDHLLRHARIHRRGRRVIEVNREFHRVPVKPTPRLPCRACPEARSPIPCAPPAARRGRRASPNRGTRTSCR